MTSAVQPSSRAQGDQDCPSCAFYPSPHYMPVTNNKHPKTPTSIFLLDVTSSNPGQMTLPLSLNTEERLRADRFHHPHDRDLFISAHTLKRLALGFVTGIAPDKLVFGTTHYGKPVLESASNLHFNLSHTSGMAAFAWSLTTELGIDIEHIDHIPAEIDPVWEEFFLTPQERDYLSTKLDRRQELLKFWTAKEAIAKSEGLGLTLPFNKIQVFAQLPGSRPRHRHVHNFCISHRHMAALATKNPNIIAPEENPASLQLLSKSDLRSWQTSGKIPRTLDPFASGVVKLPALYCAVTV